MKLNGRLTEDQMKDLDGLILKLKSFNLVNLVKSRDDKNVLDISDIRPIPRDENERLWTYIRHICKMAVLNGKNFASVQAICNRDRRNDVRDMVDDAVNDMSIHVYRYVWRDYESSSSEGYLYGSAYHGFKTWRDKQNDMMSENEQTKSFFDMHKGDFSGNHKVSNLNIS